MVREVKDPRPTAYWEQHPSDSLLPQAPTRRETPTSNPSKPKDEPKQKEERRGEEAEADAE